jgi:chromosome segregation ATPase
MQALRNEGSVHKVLVGGDKTQESLDEQNLIDYLTKPENESGRLRGFCIFSSKNQKSYKYTCSISRYSAKPSLRIDDVNQAKFLIGGVNKEKKLQAEQDLESASEKSEILKIQIEELQRDIDEKIRLHNESKARWEALRSNLQSFQSARNRVERLKSKVEEQEAKVSVDNLVEKKHLLKQIMARMKNAVAAIESHTDSNRKQLQATFSNAGIKINESILISEHRLTRYEKVVQQVCLEA